VEFLGRADNQVKIRGFRVEPGEVEQLLREHPQVAEAAVVARERTVGDLRLVAYVVGKDDSPMDIAEMRRFLAERVPDYMIPSALVTLEALPMTTSGKVDRRALPAPDWSRSSLCGEFVAPRTAMEEQLATIWREVLNIERVGVHDSFFDIGGNSLLALRLTSRVRSSLAVDLPLVTLFTTPTVAGLAEAIEKMPEAAGGEALAPRLPGDSNVGLADAVRLFDAFVLHGFGEADAMASVRAANTSAGRRWRSLLPLRPGGGPQPLFCIHGLGGHVAAFLPLARALPEGRPVYGLQGQGLDPGEEPHDSIEAMAAFYAGEIREAQPHGPYLLCGWSMGGLIALEIAQRFDAAGEETSLVAMLDSYLSLADYDKLDLDERSVIRWIAPHLGLSVAELKKLPMDQQWEQIAQTANLAQGIGVAEIRRLAAVCKAHLAAAASYRPQPYSGRAVLFRAGNAWGVQDRRWRSLCPELRMETVPGDHYSILRRPDVDVLAERLGRCLDAVADMKLPAIK
jgi:thioesterase domain-containing protein/acyl carrier protein